MIKCNSWARAIEIEGQKPYYKILQKKLKSEYNHKNIYPTYDNIFKAFELTSFNDVKVIILGQDPYHGKNQAMGLSFSTPANIKNPPSVQNIFKEIKSDLGYESCAINGDLSIWAKQGVLLLNTILTVEQSKPKSHKGIGWELFTDEIIRLLSKQKEHLIFLLWGTPSQKKASLIDKNRHLILKAPHPSPLSAYRGFLGCKAFSRCNKYLIKHQFNPINW